MMALGIPIPKNKDLLVQIYELLLFIIVKVRYTDIP